MATSTVFTNNRTQAVRLPAETRFPEHIKKVEVRIVGNDRVISPANAGWDSFFFGGPESTADFMHDRADQTQRDRDTLE